MNEDEYEYCVEMMWLKGSELLFGLLIVLDMNCEDIKAGDRVLFKY